MVVRVVGKLDGEDVIFTQKDGAWHICAPLKQDSGNYTIEVYAIDEAGNMDFVAQMLCTIDPNGSCMHQIKLKDYLEHVSRCTQLKYLNNNPYLEVAR